MRRTSDSGWTFIESIVVIAIIVVLSGTVAFSASDYLERARVASARAQIEAMSIALRVYAMDTGGYPTQAQGLGALWERPVLVPVPRGWNGPYTDRPPGTDPWGEAFIYGRAEHQSVPFTIRSLGADRLPGGTGHAKDIVTHEPQ